MARYSQLRVDVTVGSHALDRELDSEKVMRVSADVRRSTRPTQTRTQTHSYECGGSDDSDNEQSDSECSEDNPLDTACTACKVECDSVHVRDNAYRVSRKRSMDGQPLRQHAYQHTQHTQHAQRGPPHSTQHPLSYQLAPRHCTPSPSYASSLCSDVGMRFPLSGAALDAPGGVASAASSAVSSLALAERDLHAPHSLPSPHAWPLRPHDDVDVDDDADNDDDTYDEHEHEHHRREVYFDGDQPAANYSPHDSPYEVTLRTQPSQPRRYSDSESSDGSHTPSSPLDEPLPPLRDGLVGSREHYPPYEHYHELHELHELPDHDRHEAHTQPPDYAPFGGPSFTAGPHMPPHMPPHMSHINMQPAAIAPHVLNAPHMGQVRDTALPTGSAVVFPGSSFGSIGAAGTPGSHEQPPAHADELPSFLQALPRAPFLSLPLDIHAHSAAPPMVNAPVGGVSVSVPAGMSMNVGMNTMSTMSTMSAMSSMSSMGELDVAACYDGACEDSRCGCSEHAWPHDTLRPFSPLSLPLHMPLHMPLTLPLPPLQPLHSQVYMPMPAQPYTVDMPDAIDIGMGGMMSGMMGGMSDHSYACAPLELMLHAPSHAPTGMTRLYRDGEMMRGNSLSPSPLSSMSSMSSMSMSMGFSSQPSTPLPPSWASSSSSSSSAPSPSSSSSSSSLSYWPHPPPLPSSYASSRSTSSTASSVHSRSPSPSPSASALAAMAASSWKGARRAIKPTATPAACGASAAPVALGGAGPAGAYSPSIGMSSHAGTIGGGSISSSSGGSSSGSSTGSAGGCDGSKGDRIKRPMNSFLLFSNEMRAQLQERNKELSNAQISKLLGEHWKAMTPDDKRKYVERAKRIKAEFNMAHPNYVYTKSKGKPRRRRSRLADSLEEPLQHLSGLHSMHALHSLPSLPSHAIQPHHTPSFNLPSSSPSPPSYSPSPSSASPWRPRPRVRSPSPPLSMSQSMSTGSLDSERPRKRVALSPPAASPSSPSSSSSSSSSSPPAPSYVSPPLAETVGPFVPCDVPNCTAPQCAAQRYVMQSRSPCAVPS